MKKNLFLSAFAVIAMLSCNKTQTETENIDQAVEDTYVPDSVSLSPEKDRINAADSSKPTDSLRTGDVPTSNTDSAK